jgi:hypothetical protein
MDASNRDALSAVVARQRGRQRLRSATVALGTASLVVAGAIAYTLPSGTAQTGTTTVAAGTTAATSTGTTVHTTSGGSAVATTTTTSSGSGSASAPAASSGTSHATSGGS